VKAKTFHWSSSRNEDSVGEPHEIIDEILPEEIQKYEDAIDSDSESSSTDDSYSSSMSSSEDEIIKEARLVLSDSINSKLYTEPSKSEEIRPMRSVGGSKVRIGPVNAKEQNSIGNKIVNNRIERLQKKCIEVLGEINFKHVYRFLLRIFKSGQSGDPIVMEELKEMVGAQLASQCMVVEELIMVEQQVAP